MIRSSGAAGWPASGTFIPCRPVKGSLAGFGCGPNGLAENILKTVPFDGCVRVLCCAAANAAPARLRASALCSGHGGKPLGGGGPLQCSFGKDKSLPDHCAWANDLHEIAEGFLCCKSE